MTQSDNIVEFLKYASPRLDCIEHCMEKQALSAGLLARAAFKARQLGKSPARLKRLMGANTRAIQRPDGSMAFMYQDTKIPNLYRMVGDDASGFGQKFLLDVRKGKVRSVQQTFGGYRNPHHSNLNGTVLPSQQSTAIVPYQPAPTSTALAPVRPTPTVNVPPAAPAAPAAAAKTTGEAAKATDEVAKATGEAAKVTDEAANTVGSSIGSWMGRHPYLTIGAGVGLGAGGAAVGYNSGSSTGREEAAKALQLYYAMRESMQRQNLQSANSSFLSRLANLFGTGELSNMIG